MGESKVCSSCGDTIPAEAVFCPNCGGAQQKPEEPVQASSNIEINRKPDEGIVQEVKHADQNMNDAKPEFVQPVRQAPVQQPQPKPVQPNYAAQPAPQMQRPQQAPQTYQQPQQAAPGYQQPYYGQPQQPAEPAKPKKKFPWVFTIVWVVMLAFVGVWAFLWTTYPEGQSPEITTDTLRVLSLVVSVILLIYTLNIRIATRKLKALPTILLIISLLVSAFMFCSFELIEGDFAHDILNPITDAIFQVQ